MKNKQLQVSVDNDVLSISIGLKTLCHACETGRSYGLEGIKITDKELFIKGVAHQLIVEKEDGSTPVHEMLDNVVSQMLEDGEEGVELGDE